MTHDWDTLEEALGTALAEVCGWEDNPAALQWSFLTGGEGEERRLIPYREALSFETLTTIVWERYLKPRGWQYWTIGNYLDGTHNGYVGRPRRDVEADGPTPEVALARAFGKALEAGS